MHRKLVVFLISLTAMTANAATSQQSSTPAGLWATGGVTYKHPNGALVNRDCRLWVPARGQGEVKLSCSGTEIATTDFNVEVKESRKIFTVNFQNVPGAPEGTQAQYRGTYLRGSNRAIYYGDIFTKLTGSENTDWQYTGGFMFFANVPNSGDSAE